MLYISCGGVMFTFVSSYHYRLVLVILPPYKKHSTTCLFCHILPFRKYSGITEAVKCSSITKQQRARLNEELGRHWATEVTFSSRVSASWCSRKGPDTQFTNALRGTGVFM